MEYAIATNWLLRAGILIVVLGMGFFLKYSMERNYIGPVARCVLSVLAGLGMTAVGVKLTGRKYHLLGLGLVGGGLVVLYWSVYAMTVFYGVLPQAWSLPMMIVVTVGAGFLALRLKSPLVAIIGLVGGYGCPILMSVHEADVIGIMLYMLVLGGGVLAISFWRNWHLLNYLGFIFNYGIVITLHRHFTGALFWPLLSFLVLFFGLYAAAMYMHSFARRQKSTLIEMAGQVLNSVFFFWLAGELVRKNYTKEWVALVSLGLAAFFIVHVIAFIARKLTDRNLLVVLMGLSVFYLTISMPILLADDWLTVAWSIQALIMLWAARRLGSSFLRNLSYAVYTIAMMRVFAWDVDREFGRQGVQLPSEYWHALADRILVFLATIISLFGGFWLHRRDTLTGRLAVDPQSDVSAPALSSAGKVFFWGGLLFTFIYLHLECNQFYSVICDPLRPAGLTVLWVVLGAYLAYRVAKGDSTVALPLLFVCGVGLGFKIILFDLPFWSFDYENFICGDGTYSFLDASFRALDFALIIGLLFGVFALTGVDSRGDRAVLRTLFGFMGVGVLFLYLTLELNSALTVFKQGFRAGAISILWSFFAFAFLLSGLRRDRQGLRFIGLALFVVVVVKVFMVDLMQLDPLYRIIAFIVLGIVVTAGSFVYLFFRHSVEVPEINDSDD